MISLILSALFYLLAGLIFYWRIPKHLRLLAWGSLPVAWISFLSLVGLLETLTGVPSQIGVIAFLVLLIFLIASRHRQDLVSLSFRRPKLAECGAGTFLASAITLAFYVSTTTPWGSWDPMFTWVMRARFLAEGGALWSQGFSNDLALLHPDYPPMFSWALLPLWRFDGVESSLAVASLVYPFFVGLFLVLSGWSGIFSGRSQLCSQLAVGIVFSTPLFLYLFTIKSLDFIVCYAILTSLAWYDQSRKNDSSCCWTVCAFVVTWASLVKNEGQLWVLAFFGSLIILYLVKSFELQKNDDTEEETTGSLQFLPLLKGAAIPVLFLLLFKVTLAPPSDLIDPTRTFELSLVVQPEVFINPPYSLLVRLDQVENPDWHLVIWKHFGEVVLLWKSWWLLLYCVPVLLFISLIWCRKTFPGILLAILLQICGYYCVYLLSPYNPYWHVSNSMGRLIVHVIPAVVCLLAFSFHIIEENEQENKIGIPLTQHLFWVLPLLSVCFCFYQIQMKAFPWNFQNESLVYEKQLKELNIPKVKTASFVSSKFETATLYRTQFFTVPTVLVLDRREEILVGRFETEEELKKYCQQNGWELKANSGGLGWAGSIQPNGPLPHMERIREMMQQQNH